MIEVDGSHGEGGGQLVRNAAALAAVTGKVVRVTNIRAKRAKPGLAAQHTTALRAIAALANAEIEGLEIGSREVVVKPGSLTGGTFRFDAGTAGSVTLVLQACLPAALRSPDPVELRLVGGTDVKWAPPADYFLSVFLPLLRRMGGHVEMEVLRRGYYPRGGGEVRVTVIPCPQFRPLVVEPPGTLQGIQGVAHGSRLPERVPKRMKRAAVRHFVGLAEAKIAEVVLGAQGATGAGGAIVLWAERERTVLGASAVAERGVLAERLGNTVGEELLSDLRAEASLDVHAADQVLIYAALASGVSRFTTREMSAHMETAMWLIQKFVDVRFDTSEISGRTEVRIVPG